MNSRPRAQRAFASRLSISPRCSYAAASRPRDVRQTERIKRHEDIHERREPVGDFSAIRTQRARVNKRDVRLRLVSKRLAAAADKPADEAASCFTFN